MPIYEYACPGRATDCPKGHIIDHVHRFSDGERPSTIRCGAHDTEATYKIALPAIGIVAGSDNPVRARTSEWTEEERTQKHRGLDFGTFDYRCEACDKTFNELVDFRNGETAEAPRPCPTCGAMSPQTFTMSHVDGTMTMYPYFNRGLGCVVESAQHVRDICKERGLIAVEGDYDAERMYAEHTREGREAEAWYKADMKQRWDDPEMREYRDEYKERTGQDFIAPF